MNTEITKKQLIEKIKSHINLEKNKIFELQKTMEDYENEKLLLQEGILWGLDEVLKIIKEERQ